MNLPRFTASQDVMRAFQRVHFIGIGGSGMSGIAEVLLNLGFTVSGSDAASSEATQRLHSLGAEVRIGHDPLAVANADVVVISSAITQDNCELKAARAARVPVVPRAEMLAELMRFRRGIAVAGTHGKTTTTSLTASILAEGGLDPTFVIGGRLNSAGANARLGGGDYLVAESDESDGSFLLLNPVIAIVTNIDADHLENYDGQFSRLRAAFESFLHRLPFYGLAVMCADDPECAALAETLPRSVLRYGTGADCDVRASNIAIDGARSRFQLHLPDAAPVPVELALPGRHNVLNACAAAAVALQVGVPVEATQRALAQFKGVGRRFHLHGEIGLTRGQVLLVDDYGHHPRELQAVFEAARAGWPSRRLVVAFQPHRYSRTRALLEDFAAVLAGADLVLITEVYAAGEAVIEGADGRALARAVRARGRAEPIFVAEPKQLMDVLPDVLQDGDLLLLQGAGSIGALAGQIRQRGHLRKPA